MKVDKEAIESFVEVLCLRIRGKAEGKPKCACGHRFESHRLISEYEGEPRKPEDNLVCLDCEAIGP